MHDLLSDKSTTNRSNGGMAAESQEQSSSGYVHATLDRPADGRPTAAGSKPSSSPPPPPPIDVIAIDVTSQLLPAPPEDVPRRHVEEERQSNTSDDGEYRHSPLGGAMPESDDSSVAGEFVFP